MPLYEYRCRRCGHVSTFLVGVTVHAPTLRCIRCGGEELERLISRVHHLLGEEERLERMMDPSMLSGVDENDPRSIARWARTMGKTLGDEAGEDFDELVDEIEESAAQELKGQDTEEQPDEE